MADKKLLRKIAPIIMSAAVAMTSSPVGVMAEDFTSGEAAVEVSEETTYGSDEISDNYDESSEADDSADFATDTEDGFESGEAAEEESGFEDGETGDTEDAFLADTEGETNNEAGAVKTVEDGQIVLMNIPYEAFYRSELKNNDVKVDAFTSATLNKSRTKGMMNGNVAYHTDAAGTNLAGITFPVKVIDASVLNNNADKYKQVTDSTSVTIAVTNKGQTSENTYTGKDALIEAADYSYYVLTADAAPAYYKELTVDADGNISFGTVQGMSAQTVSIGSTFKTDTKYGDYELDLNKETLAGVIDTAADSIYGAVINTTDGTTYALRHLENIWKGSHLAWSTGFTTTVHGCPVSSAHYVSMMGKTISSVTYYTNKGIINFDIEDTYVPVTTGAAATAVNVKTTDTAVKVEFAGDLPADFSKEYAVDGVKAEATEDGVKVADLTPGTHTLTISDANGKYASISTTFTATTDVMPAAYDEYEGKLVAAADITAEQFAAYTKAVSKVKIGEKEYAASGKGSVKVVQGDGSLDHSKTEVKDGDTVTVSASGYADFSFVYNENVYVYAGLTWAEYWSSEDVYNAGSTASSEEKDRRGESDLGAFDAVTRATANHGLHRGSYQCMATIYTTEGNTYQLSYWKSSTEPVLADGTVAIWTPADRKTGTPASIQVNGGAKESLDHYAVTGIKYVPVQVKAEDYADFAAKYPVVKNGEILVGGFSENNLKAYSETANVTVNTNGLKTVTKNEDGSFSFSARKTGTESGIQGTDLKVATGIKPEVKTASGSYGEFLRVDLNGNYGGLGAAMQAVKWDYYGNGNTVLATYGTKFAADNWMHKMMGIQLGLTHSVRCQLPAGTDGTGHWKLTVYALGYQDYTFEFDATATNIVTSTDPSTIDTTALKAALEKVKALNKDDYTEESWKKVEDEATETQEMLKEIEAAIKNKTTVAFSQAAVDEQVNEHLTAAINGLVKKEKPVEPVVTPDVKPTVTPGKNETKPTATPTPVVKPGITAKVSQVYVGKKATIKVTKTKVTGKVTFKSSNKKVATVNSKGVITGKKAGKTVITVKVGKYTKKLTVTVKKPSFKLVKSSAKLKKGKKTTIRVKAAPVSKVTYKTSNKKVATVNSKGVVTAKKKGTAKITVKCNGITRTFKVTVK